MKPPRWVTADRSREVTVISLDGQQYYRVRSGPFWLADVRTPDALARLVDLAELEETRNEGH